MPCGAKVVFFLSLSLLLPFLFTASEDRKIRVGYGRNDGAAPALVWSGLGRSGWGFWFGLNSRRAGER